MAALPTPLAQPPLPGHAAKASLTTREIPGPFISRLWPHAALGTAWHGEGTVALGCRGQMPVALLLKFTLVEVGKISAPSFWDRVR